MMITIINVIVIITLLDAITEQYSSKKPILEKSLRQFPVQMGETMRCEVRKVQKMT